MERVVVLIGVARSGLPPLPAVQAGLDAMGRWAHSQGLSDDQIITVSDAGGSTVRARDVYDAVSAVAARRTVEQLIVYFCGHGVYNGGTDLWLLSGAPSNPNEAVNVVKSVRLATRGLIPHVVLIADACRSATTTIQFDELEGSAIFPSPPAAGRTNRVDSFMACRLEDVASQVAEPDNPNEFRAVYSEVVAEALEGAHSELLEQSNDVDGTWEFVRPRRLMDELPQLVDDRISELGQANTVIQVPVAMITSDPVAWLSRIPLRDESPRRGGGPDPIGPRPGPVRNIEDPAAGAAKDAAERLASAPPPPDTQHSAALRVLGGEATHWESTDCALRQDADGSVGVDLQADQRAGSVLIAFAPDRVAIVPMFLDRYATLTVEKSQLVDVRYTPIARHNIGAPTDINIEHERATIAAASRFGLHWWHERDVEDLLERLEPYLRVDPALAVYVAYGLADMGRWDLLDRLAKGQGGPVPYDVAILADNFRTPHVPSIPMMSRGWPLLGSGEAAPKPDAPPRVHSPWTAFSGAALDALRTLLPKRNPQHTVKRGIPMKKLVLIHGRSAQGKADANLEGAWLRALQSGFDRAGVGLDISPADSNFAFYGDALFALTKDRPGAAADVIIQGDGELNAAEKAFVGAAVEDAVSTLGVTDDEIRQHAPDGSVIEMGPQNWWWVRAALRALEDVPGVGSAALALATKDVYKYLHRPGIQTDIEDGVARAFEPSKDHVVIAHSLGSIVAYNVLKRRARNAEWRVGSLITVGSPLAVRPIVDALSPIARPFGVTDWFNAYDPRDIVSLHPLDEDHFPVTPGVDNYGGVDNTTRDRHGISGYLSDPVVARRIYDALLS